MDLIASAAARAEPIKKDDVSNPASNKLLRFESGTLGNKPIIGMPQLK